METSTQETLMINVLNKLNSKLEADEVSTRIGGGNTTLSYVSGYYVIAKLNEIFGQDNWAYTSIVNKIVEQEKDGRYYVAYTATVRLVVEFPNGKKTEFTDVGFGDGTDRSLGKAHESAVKESVTDGVKRCAKNLGNRMGLALYDKTQEFVEKKEAPVKQAGVSSVVSNMVKKELVSDDSAALAAQIKKIGSAAQVLMAKGTQTPQTLTTYINEKYGVSKKEELSLKQAQEFFQYLDNQTKENAG